jgi:hypothetical protein
VIIGNLASSSGRHTTHRAAITQLNATAEPAKAAGERLAQALQFNALEIVNVFGGSKLAVARWWCGTRGLTQPDYAMESTPGVPDH